MARHPFVFVSHFRDGRFFRLKLVILFRRTRASTRLPLGFTPIDEEVVYCHMCKKKKRERLKLSCWRKPEFKAPSGK